MSLEKLLFSILALCMDRSPGRDVVWSNHILQHYQEVDMQQHEITILMGNAFTAHLVCGSAGNHASNSDHDDLKHGKHFEYWL